MHVKASIESEARLLNELEHSIDQHSGSTHAILRKVTDLFASCAGNYTPETLSLYDGVFSKLVEHIDASARAALSERLADYDQAPEKIAKALALDSSIEVAEPMLARGALSDETLAECAANGTQQHLLSIASRKHVSETLSDIIITRGDDQVLGTLIKNEGAEISESGFERLVDNVVAKDWLADCLSLRNDISESVFRSLVSRASDEVRQRIAERVSQRAIKSTDPDDRRVVNRSLAGLAYDSIDYRVAGLAVTERAGGKTINESLVADFANEQKFAEVAVALSRLCNIQIEEIENIFARKWESPVAIILKALGFHLPTLTAIHQCRPYANNRDESDFRKVKSEFISVRQATAQRILRFYQIQKRSSSKVVS